MSGRVLLGRRRADVHGLPDGQVFRQRCGQQLEHMHLLRVRQVLRRVWGHLIRSLPGLPQRDLLRRRGGHISLGLPGLPGQLHELPRVQTAPGVRVLAGLLWRQRAGLLALQCLRVVPVRPGQPLPPALEVRPHLVVAGAMPLLAWLLRGHHDGRAGAHAVSGAEHDTHAHF